MQRVQDGIAMAVVGDAFGGQQCAAPVDAEHASIGGRGHGRANALHRPAQLNAPQREEVVKGCDFHFGSGKVPAELAREPYGYQCERVAVGKVEAVYTQHLSPVDNTEVTGNVGGGGFKREIEHSALRLRARGFECSFNGRDPPEGLTHRVVGGKPPAAPPRKHQSIDPQRLKRLANGDATDAERGTEFGFARQRSTGSKLALRKLASKALGHIQVSHNLYCSCLFLEMQVPQRAHRRSEFHQRIRANRCDDVVAQPLRVLHDDIANRSAPEFREAKPCHPAITRTGRPSDVSALFHPISQFRKAAAGKGHFTSELGHRHSAIRRAMQPQHDLKPLRGQVGDLVEMRLNLDARGRIGLDNQSPHRDDVIIRHGRRLDVRRTAGTRHDINVPERLP